MQPQCIQKNLTILTTAIVAFVLISGSPSLVMADSEKITICHTMTEGGVGTTIEISLNAYDNSGHADHEFDEEGACEDSKKIDSDGDGLSDRDDICPNDSTNTCNDPTDTTSPVITSTITCSKSGNNGWCIGDVLIEWTIEDPESTITQSNGCDNIIVNYDTVGEIFTCSATSEGGETSISTPTIKRDATIPSISAGSQSPSPNENGWNNSTVEVSFICSDATSGVVEEEVINIISNEGKDQSTTAVCEDIAGNSSESSFSGINIDMTNPTFGDALGPYILNQPVSVSCEDELSGIQTCNGEILTSFVGENSNQISAIDLAGNEATNQVNYSIHYDLACLGSDGGFKSPIPNTNYKVGRSIPEKFNACDYYGNSVSTVVATSLIDGNNAPSAGNSSRDSLFRYDEIDMQYIFVFSSKGLNTGEHVLSASLDSGQIISTTVTFTK